MKTNKHQLYVVLRLNSIRNLSKRGIETIDTLTEKELLNICAKISEETVTLVKLLTKQYPF